MVNGLSQKWMGESVSYFQQDVRDGNWSLTVKPKAVKGIKRVYSYMMNKVMQFLFQESRTHEEIFLGSRRELGLVHTLDVFEAELALAEDVTFGGAKDE